MARLSFCLKLASPLGLLSKDIYHGLALEASNGFTAEISIASFFYRERNSRLREKMGIPPVSRSLSFSASPLVAWVHLRRHKISSIISPVLPEL